MGLTSRSNSTAACGMRLAERQLQGRKGQYKSGSSKDNAPRLTQDLGQGQTIGTKRHYGAVEDCYRDPSDRLGPRIANRVILPLSRIGLIILDGRSIEVLRAQECGRGTGGCTRMVKRRNAYC